jgi:hypothetical protein
VRPDRAVRGFALAAVLDLKQTDHRRLPFLREDSRHEAVKLRPSKDKKEFMYEYGQLVGLESRRDKLQAEAESLPGVYIYESRQPNRQAVPDDQFNATYATWSALWRLAYEEWTKAQLLLGMVGDIKIDKAVAAALSKYSDSSRDATARCQMAIEHMDAARLNLTVEQLRESRTQAG